MKELESLRSRQWDRDDHQKEMEAMLMWTHQQQGATRPKFGFVAAALLLACGALFGAVSTTFVYEYKGQTITTTDYDDGSSRVVIEEDGETVFDEVLEPGVMLFQIEDEDCDDDDGSAAGSAGGALLEVTPVEEPTTAGDHQ
ncbi:MAG: hypothetical protein AAF581_07460 [Planctomycetota bacterium]